MGWQKLDHKGDSDTSLHDSVPTWLRYHCEKSTFFILKVPGRAEAAPMKWGIQSPPPLVQELPNFPPKQQEAFYHKHKGELRGEAPLWKEQDTAGSVQKNPPLPSSQETKSYSLCTLFPVKTHNHCQTLLPTGL